MQLPPLDRTVNWPPAGADSPAAGANAATPPRASRTETTAIQTAVAKSQLPEPSVKIEISSAFDEIVKQEKAAEAKAATNPLADAAPAGAGKPVDADEAEKNALAIGATKKSDSSTGTETPTESARKVDAGKLPGPDQPTADKDGAAKDWTEKAKAAEDKPPEPPAEPISKKLLDFLQNLWRAGGQAIDVVDETNKVLNPVKASDSPLTYSDPSVKKASGA